MVRFWAVAMSAAVCGKRLPPFEDVHRSAPIVAKRLRYTSSLSPSDNMSRLIALFPAMDPQVGNLFIELPVLSL